MVGLAAREPENADYSRSGKVKSDLRNWCATPESGSPVRSSRELGTNKFDRTIDWMHNIHHVLSSLKF